MQSYFKVTHNDGSIALFDTNNKLAADMAKKVYEESGSKVSEVTKSEYKRLEHQIP